MCLYTRIIPNKKYVANKKNGGVIPPLPQDKNGQPDKRVMGVPVKCGKCIECYKQKANLWRIRLGEEIKQNTNGIFVTLTFNNETLHELTKEFLTEGYQLENDIATIAVRRFLERWRKKKKKA